MILFRYIGSIHIKTYLFVVHYVYKICMGKDSHDKY